MGGVLLLLLLGNFLGGRAANYLTETRKKVLIAEIESELAKRPIMIDRRLTDVRDMSSEQLKKAIFVTLAEKDSCNEKLDNIIGYAAGMSLERDR